MARTKQIPMRRAPEAQELSTMIETEANERPPAQQPALSPLAVKRAFPYIPPNILNPILLVVISIAISSTLTILASQYVGEEMGTMQNEIPVGYWVYVVNAWRVLKPLGIWFGGFGGELHSGAPPSYEAVINGHYSGGERPLDVPVPGPDNTLPIHLPPVNDPAGARVLNVHLDGRLGAPDLSTQRQKRETPP